MKHFEPAILQRDKRRRDSENESYGGVGDTCSLTFDGLHRLCCSYFGEGRKDPDSWASALPGLHTGLEPMGSRCQAY